MAAATRTSRRTVWVAIRAMALFTLLLGVAYPLVITGAGQLALPAQANGSLLAAPTAPGGQPVGSSLIGQQFLTASGEPDPEFFQPRPSAAGDGYDAAASSGSNLGPENADLVAAIGERKRAVAAFNGVPESRVPADAVTASSSGLDPHISEAYAAIQIDRVAAARGLAQGDVAALVEEHTQGPDLGFLGESRVNVLELNLALEQLRG